MLKQINTVFVMKLLKQDIISLYCLVASRPVFLHASHLCLLYILYLSYYWYSCQGQQKCLVSQTPFAEVMFFRLWKLEIEWPFYSWRWDGLEPVESHSQFHHRNFLLHHSSGDWSHCAGSCYSGKQNTIERLGKQCGCNSCFDDLCASKVNVNILQYL